VHGFYRALRAFLSWWEMEIEPQGWSNPLRKVKPPRVDDPPLEPVSIDDLRAMLTTCQRRRFYGARDRALMLFLLDSGLRRAEFQALDVGHVNLDNGSVVVIRGKGGKPRTAFLHHLTRHIRPRWCRSRAIAESSGPWTIGRGTTKM
jgi:integrase